MTPSNVLVNKVKKINANEVQLPVLRELLNEIQTKTTEGIVKDAEYWTDSKWSQWKEHSSHNPW